MGLEFELFKKEKSERFDFGKHYFWCEVFQQKMGVDYHEEFNLRSKFKDFDEFYKLVVDVWREESVDGFYYDEITLKEMHEMAKYVWDWCASSTIEFNTQSTFSDYYGGTIELPYKFEEVYPYTATIFDVFKDCDNSGKE